MVDQSKGADAQVVMPVGDLHGRVVWTADGQRLGVVRDVHTEDDGRVVSFDVRERWFFGPRHELPAAGMRIDDGDIILPSSVLAVVERRETDVRRERQRADAVAVPAVAPVLLAGREGASQRFGGLDLVGSLFGALVTFASIVLIGGLLVALFDTGVASFDTGLDSADAVFATSLLVGAVTLFVSCVLGGWCAGRSARFDGVANGLFTVVWVLGLGVAFGALGAWIGDEYDVFQATAIPGFVTEDYAVWGTLAFVAAFVVMLVGAALGGALGESWHRRADRAMLDVVSVNQSGPSWIDDSDAVLPADEGGASGVGEGS